MIFTANKKLNFFSITFSIIRYTEVVFKKPKGKRFVNCYQLD